MAIHITFARFMNDLLSRIVGGAGIGATVLGVAMIATNAEAVVSVFRGDLFAAAALAALFSLAAVLLMPGLTRRFFHGPLRGRRRRGAAQIAVAAGVLVLGIVVVNAATSEAEWADISGFLIQGALAALAVLALTWLVPGTGLDPDALSNPALISRRQRKAQLRSMRHSRVPRRNKS